MSITYRGENRWRFRITKNGKLFETTYYSTKFPKLKDGKAEIAKEIKDAHDAYRSDVLRDKIFSAEKLTLDELFDIVNEQYISSLGDSTICLYNTMYKEHISPKFGSYVLTEITKLDIQKYINEKISSKSIRTVHLIFSVMNLIFNKSIEWDILDKNPCTNTKLPELEKNNYTELLSETDISKLLFWYEKEPETLHKLAFYLAFGCGLRMGEVLGIKVGDIDFKKSSLSISRQVGKVIKDGKVKIGVKDPKTKNSIRKVYIPNFVMQCIKERMKDTGCIGSDDFLMINYDGKITTETYLRNYFKKVLKDNGIPSIRFHDLRHLKASIMLNSGANVVTVARTLGDTIDTIIKTYAHTIDDIEIQSAKDYEKYISDTKTKNKHLS